MANILPLTSGGGGAHGRNHCAGEAKEEEEVTVPTGIDEAEE